MDAERVEVPVDAGEDWDPPGYVEPDVDDPGPVEPGHGGACVVES